MLSSYAALKKKHASKQKMRACRLRSIPPWAGRSGTVGEVHKTAKIGNTQCRYRTGTNEVGLCSVGGVGNDLDVK
jgi:hypothetical protein